MSYSDQSAQCKKKKAKTWIIFCNVEILARTCPIKMARMVTLELPHFIETAFVHSLHCRLLSQVQETILRKMHCAYSVML